jgi:hypothetical protein
MPARKTKSQGPTKQVLVRMPEALWVHIKDESLAHNRTFNAQVVHLLMGPRRKVYQDIRQAVRERMEDLYGPHWYENLSGLDVPGDTRTDEEIEASIEWLPGSKRYDHQK